MLKKKAIVLLSGGLDSTLAVKLVLEQGLEVEAVNFKTIFWTQDQVEGYGAFARRMAKRFGIELRIFEITKKFVEMLKCPKHGYGTNMNPCIDCRILMLEMAAEYMEEIGASFLVTGEVLGERPMSQRQDALNLIEKESDLKGKILRPLYAKLLKPTIAEKEGLIDREKLFDIQGRSRRSQMDLAEAYGIDDYPSPAGGCLLTDPGFSARLRDLFQHNDSSINDIQLLKYGRHFRLSEECKVIVGRDERENEGILSLAMSGDLVIKVANFSGPITIVRGKVSDEQIYMAAAMTARYSKARGEKTVGVSYRRMPEREAKSISVRPVDAKELKLVRI